MVSPCLLVIRNCVCDTPLPLRSLSALQSQVYLGNAQRRERNPAGRGDWAQEGGGVGGGMFFFFFFLPSFPFFGCVSTPVMDSSSRGSRRSGQSRGSSDLVRNAAVLYLCVFFVFFPPAFCRS